MLQTVTLLMKFSPNLRERAKKKKNNTNNTRAIDSFEKHTSNTDISTTKNPPTPSNDQTETKPKYISLVSTTNRRLTKKPFCVYICTTCEKVSRYPRWPVISSRLHVPKGGQTVNWAGESPNYIPFQIRNQSQHLRWSERTTHRQ